MAGEVTDLTDATLRELVIPPILYFLNLTILAEQDSDVAINDMLCTETLQDILVLELNGDGVASVRHTVGLKGDGIEERREAVPLRSELIVALGERDGILEYCCWGPEGKMLERRTAFEELYEADM